jgi:deoxycytidine triphosphate deaminase
MSSDSQKDLGSDIFARTDEEAACWFERYKSEDPFPEIAPALLNSADIMDYVAATGMIHPFYPEIGVLKSASYEVNLLGEVVYWDEKGKVSWRRLEKGEEFVLRQNSIAFVTPEPMFRLPDYIALRFNLRIKLVHKGLLLGTGPLVDPGFVGRLLIPLHNLTTNDYTFRGGDPLIWIEFTKLGPNECWTGRERRTNVYHRVGSYVPFPHSKKNRLSYHYLHAAAGDRPIRSSIPDAIERARRSAQEAEEKAQSIARNVTWAGVGSIIGLVVALSFGLYQIASLIQDSNVYVKEAHRELHSFQLEFDRQMRPAGNALEKIRFLENEVQELKKQLKDISKSLESCSAVEEVGGAAELQDEPSP